MREDLFLNKSKHWNMNSKRVQGAKAIAQTIMKNISLHIYQYLLFLNSNFFYQHLLKVYLHFHLKDYTNKLFDMSATSYGAA